MKLLKTTEGRFVNPDGGNLLWARVKKDPDCVVMRFRDSGMYTVSIEEWEAWLVLTGARSCFNDGN